MRTYDNYEYDQDLIKIPPEPNTEIIVVIPSNNEQDIKNTLENLVSAQPLNDAVIEIIIVINESEQSEDELTSFHDEQVLDLISWARNIDLPSFKLYPVRARRMPAKYAGVGLARKIGMDEALKRFISINRTDGVIACLDADVKVSSNYFSEIHSAYRSDQNLRAANVFFEHELDESLSPNAKNAILQYELHLRYHVNMQRYLNLPFAFHTVGSSMTVRASAYLSHFGMNKRKAGEDFYFLHKFIKTGDFTVINNATVYPSGRFSDRVPFGTGRVVQKLSEKAEHLRTYNYKSYLALEPLLDNLDRIYENPAILDSILHKKTRKYFSSELKKRVTEIKKQTKDQKAFRKRFFHWFDAFQLIKFLHHMRDEHYPDIPVDEAIQFLFYKLKIESKSDRLTALHDLRLNDRSFSK